MPPADEQATATPADEAPRGPRYRFLADEGGLAASWLASGVAEVLDLGRSVGGRTITCLQFGGQGPVPLDARPTVLLVGGLDGRSIAGSEAVLTIVDALLADPATLPGDVTFLAIPWANPDGLARWFADGCQEGRNDRGTDDDGDGRVDEDPPDDLDGDGVLLEMLIPDPNGSWVRSEDGRFLRPARAGEAPRYVRTREGRDDDGDGLFNEDPQGGVALDHNFPVHWRGAWEEPHAGAWPLSEPETRALADLALERRTVLALLYQGHHGQLVVPGGRPAEASDALDLPLPADVPTYRLLGERFAQRTGRADAGGLRLWEAYGEEVPGSALDWLYAAAGALAVEVGVWGPHVDDPARTPGEPSSRAVDAARRSLLDPVPAGGAALERAFGQWIDQRRGGLGFAAWQPIDLGGGREALLGGWRPRTCFNPPLELLPAALEGQAAFVLELSRRLPRFSIELDEVRLRDRIGLVRARVRNEGGLPTGVGPAQGRFGTELRLVLPEGVRLLAGEQRASLGHLPAGATSETHEWLVVATEESVLRLEVDCRWTLPVHMEVRFEP